MPVLAPMSPQTFTAFAAEANEAYARDHVVAGSSDAEESLAKATAQFNQLLPQGFDTPNHFFYEVHDGSGTAVGYVWFAVVGVRDDVFTLTVIEDGRLAQVMTDLAAPNGLAFSPDEKILYVVEAARCRTG